MDDQNLNPPPPGEDSKAVVLDEAKRTDQLREALAFDKTERPPAGFQGQFAASTQSFRSAVAPAVHPMAANHGVASADPPQGGKDESIPVNKGNQHMVLGERTAE